MASAHIHLSLDTIGDSAVRYGFVAGRRRGWANDDLKAAADEDRLEVLACGPRLADDRDEVIPGSWSG